MIRNRSIFHWLRRIRSSQSPSGITRSATLTILTLMACSGWLCACSSRSPAQPASARRGAEQKEHTPSIDAGPCTLDGFESATGDERILLTNIASRCEPIDHCLLDCIRSGCAQMVGGGCFHMCSARAVPPEKRDQVLLEEAAHFRACTHFLCQRYKDR